MMVVLPTTVETQDTTTKRTYQHLLMLGKQTRISNTYQEVVLMKAEALNELDQTGPAILLNDIRRRAQYTNYCAFESAG
jgi:hypothetical protein